MVFFIGSVLVVLGLIIYLLLVAQHHKTSTRDEFAGICQAVLERSSRKKRNKSAILELMKTQGEVSNADIRTQLKVSSRSIRNYLDELEKEDLIQQIGTSGRNVIYRLR